MSELRELAHLLAVDIERLSEQLFPSGRREGHEFKVGNLAGDRGRSLSICLRGSKAGVWRDFAAGVGGDAIDLIAGVRFGGRKSEAVTWARQWLGQPAAARSPAAPARASAPAPEQRPSEAAQRIFASAQPRLRDTPAEAYLTGRGIDLRQLGTQPRALRFHPALPCVEAGSRLPALVAAITNSSGGLVGVHRTWLSRASGRWQKAGLKSPKKVLGNVRGGVIRLAAGDQPIGRLVLAEGIETGLAVAVSAPQYAIWAGISIGNLAAITPPAEVSEVIICDDADGWNPPALAARQRAVDHFHRFNRTVRVARFSGGDANDLLMAAG